MVDNHDGEDVNSNPILDNQRSDKFPPVLGDNRMGVELKISQDEEIGVDIEDQTKNQSMNINERVCTVCHKVFSSGKSLGGHMRVHGQKCETNESHQNPRENDFVKKKQYEKTNTSTNCDDNNDGSIEKPTCIICGRDFKSMKSLFGHMRTHPGREYRGIHPPSSSVVLPDSVQIQVLTNSGEENENENETVIDLAESLRGWPRVTARRGRRAVEAAPPPPEEEVSTSDQLSFSVKHDTLERLAVEHLMMFSQGNSIFGNHGFSISSTVVIEESDNNLDSKSNKRKIDEIDHHPPSDDAEETVLEPVNKSDGGDQLEIKNTEQLDETADIHSPDNSSKKLMKKNNKKQKRKRRKLSDLEIAEKLLTPEPAKDKHKCSDCGKTFKTHQAFGGHRASHKKRMIVIHDTDISGNYCDIPAKPRVRRKIIKNVVEEEREENYDCKFCNKNFANSEELESHQMSAHGSSTGSSCSRGMDFDLNELPPQSGSE